MLEKEIELTTSKYANSRGVFNTKFVSVNNRGVPDRIFIYKSYVYFVEFKRKGKKLTELQLLTKERLNHCGANYVMIDSIEIGKLFIDFITSHKNNQIESIKNFIEHLDNPQ